MKINFLLVVYALLMTGLNVYKSKTQEVSDLMLRNINALANDENPDIWGGGIKPGTIAKTERCAYYDGFYFTSSVKRSCYEQYVCPSCACTATDR